MENLEEDLICDPRYLETKISPALHGNCNSWAFQSSQRLAFPLSTALLTGSRAVENSAMLILANTQNWKKKKKKQVLIVVSGFGNPPGESYVLPHSHYKQQLNFHLLMSTYCIISSKLWTFGVSTGHQKCTCIG